MLDGGRNQKEAVDAGLPGSGAWFNVYGLTVRGAFAFAGVKEPLDAGKLHTDGYGGWALTSTTLIGKRQPEPIGMYMLADRQACIDDAKGWGFEESDLSTPPQDLQWLFKPLSRPEDNDFMTDINLANLSAEDAFDALPALVQAALLAHAPELGTSEPNAQELTSTNKQTGSHQQKDDSETTQGGTV